jgi:hypothetical protein
MHGAPIPPISQANFDMEDEPDYSSHGGTSQPDDTGYLVPETTRTGWNSDLGVTQEQWEVYTKVKAVMNKLVLEGLNLGTFVHAISWGNPLSSSD